MMTKLSMNPIIVETAKLKAEQGNSHLQIVRQWKMFQWEEEIKRTTRKTAGGGTETTGTFLITENGKIIH